MKLNKKLYLKWSALLFLIIAMPLNFIYSLLVVLGYFPQLPLMGFATIVHFFSILVFFGFFWSSKNFFSNKYAVLFFFLIFVFSFYLFFGVFFSDFSYNIDVFSQTFLLTYYLIIYSFSAFCVFKYSEGLGGLWFVFLLIFFLVVLILFYLTGNFSFYFHVLNPNVNVMNYQEVSSIFFFVWFFCFATVKNKIIKGLSIPIAFLILLASGSRSEFIAFNISLIVVYMLYLSNINVGKIKNLAIVSIVLLISILFFKDNIIFFLENSRHFSVLNIESDSSWQERERLKNINMQYIYQNPLFGSYASHFYIGRGDYIHNVLSAWQQFGFAGFFIYMLLVLIPFITFFIAMLKGGKNIFHFLLLSLYCLILILGTKSVYWVHIGILFGMFICYLNSNHIAHGAVKL